jgi:phosphoglycerate dehydrogenase-like enzyme
VQLTTVSGIHAVPIGELAIALMLALARKLPTMVRKQDLAEWSEHKWRLYLGTELFGKTLGVVGYGSIGRHVARIAKLGFGMRVLALSRSGAHADRGWHEPGTGDPDGAFPDAWFTRDQLRDLLAQSDFVLLGTPLTLETHHLIGEAELRAMKASAYLVNIARGGVVDEPALIRALKENWIAGAGLDVFEQEPLPSDSELWRLPNALLAPHVSSATPHYDDRAVALFADNLRRYLRGDELFNLVNREQGY